MLDALMSDEQKCPLCDQPNRCAMAEGESVSACWCTNIRLTVDMLEAVPTKDRGVRCICATCAHALATASPNPYVRCQVWRGSWSVIFVSS